MRVRNITKEQLNTALFQANLIYRDNLHFRDLCQRGPWIQFVLRAKDSHKIGARMSASGRYSIAAAWEAHRDFYREVFRLCPNAIISTSMARYTLENFETEYPKTAWVNVGSLFRPVTMPELSITC